MDEQAAKLVILAGFVVGLVFWLIAVWLYRKMASAETVQEFEARLRGKRPPDAINTLLTESRAFASQARVQRTGENSIHVTQTGMELSVEALREGDGSRLVAVLDDSRYTRRFQIGLAAYVLIFMPAVIGGVTLGLWHYVAPSESLAVRWQSVQILQISHSLWPPFLIYFLWSKLRDQVASQISNLLVFAEAQSGVIATQPAEAENFRREMRRYS